MNNSIRSTVCAMFTDLSEVEVDPRKPPRPDSGRHTSRASASSG
jgi:hypothetical protein